MPHKLGFAVAALALANTVASVPTKLMATEHMSAIELANLTRTIDQAMLAAFECRGQSCLIADTAGSTGRIPTMKAEGASDADIACIVKYNPPVGELLRQYNNTPPNVPKQDTGFFTTLMTGLNSIFRPLTQLLGSTETGKFNATCAPNILIWAKGTFEPGPLGILVGPAFASNLPAANWSVASVPYDPDIPGDFCLGLPGGMVAKDVINQAAERCPQSNLFLSGYSQGAMVVRNGLARANDAARQRVKGVITFGDPFNGAPIKGYKGPIEIFCNNGDGVCTGNFELAVGHLSYGLDTSARLAQTKLFEMANGGGDSKCCNPPAPPPIPSPEQWAQTIAANGGKIPKAAPGMTIEQWGQAIAKSGGKVPEGSVRKVAMFEHEAYLDA